MSVLIETIPQDQLHSADESLSFSKFIDSVVVPQITIGIFDDEPEYLAQTILTKYSKDLSNEEPTDQNRNKINQVFSALSNFFDNNIEPVKTLIKGSEKTEEHELIKHYKRNIGELRFFATQQHLELVHYSLISIGNKLSSKEK